MDLFGKGGAAQQAQRAQMLGEIGRQSAIQSGMSGINGVFDKQFTPDFYAGRKQAYVDYAKPQLDTQFADAQKQLVYNLARGGNLDSSTRAQQEAELSRNYGTQNQAILDKAGQYANDAQSKVEAARAQLIAQLNATGDSSGAVNAANTQAAALAAPDTYSPLGQLFSTGTSATQQLLAQQNANAAANAPGATANGRFKVTGAVANS